MLARRRRASARSSKTVRPPSDGAICPLVGDRGVDVGVRRPALLDAAGEGVEPGHAVELVGVSHLGRVEGLPEHRDGLVVDLQRHRERMAVLAAVREREAGRIVEARRRAVHHLGDERQRLQRARTELLEQQERGEVAQLALVREGEHGAEPSRLDVRGADVVPRRHLEPPHRGERRRRILARDGEQRVLRRPRPPVDEVPDRAGMRADDRRVRIGGEVAHRRRMPVIAPRQPRSPRSCPAARPPTGRRR